MPNSFIIPGEASSLGGCAVSATAVMSCLPLRYHRTNRKQLDMPNGVPILFEGLFKGFLSFLKAFLKDSYPFVQGLFKAFLSFLKGETGTLKMLKEKDRIC